MYLNTKDVFVLIEATIILFVGYICPAKIEALNKYRKVGNSIVVDCVNAGCLR